MRGVPIIYGAERKSLEIETINHGRGGGSELKATVSFFFSGEGGGTSDGSTRSGEESH